MSKKKILFVYRHDSSFVKKDIELLSEFYDVEPFIYRSKRIFELWKKLKWCDVVFVWFVSYHTFIIVNITRKPVVVVTGGFDVAYDRSINYGLMFKPFFKYMVCIALKRVKRILSVSGFNQQEVRRNTGFESICIPNCVESEKFQPMGMKNKDIVITVGNVNKETWVRKGISKFVSLAEYCYSVDSDFQFIVIGKIYKTMKDKVREVSESIPNLVFTDFVSDEELLLCYQYAKVYCQLSSYESFGLSLAEAMLCKCIPVVSDRCEMPMIIGDTGFCVDINDMDEIYEKIKKASVSRKGHLARKRIIDRYSCDKRKQKLKKVIDAL